MERGKEGEWEGGREKGCIGYKYKVHMYIHNEK